MGKSTTEEMVILKGDEISALLANKEAEIMTTVRQAYLAHVHGESSLPHSVFLKFPNAPRNRIIGLPAFVGGKQPVAGIKWIASFPDNIDQGIERASAAIILNSSNTGQPFAFMEGSVISSRRTAGSAVLASTVLSGGVTYDAIALVGAGLINYQTMRFAHVAHPGIKQVFVYDLSTERARQFVDSIHAWQPDLNVTVCDTLEEACMSAKLVALATTASTPHIKSLDVFHSDALVLHTSLRDIAPEIIQKSINIVDDLDHVNRENTSIHLTSQVTGNTDFVQGNLGQVLSGELSMSGPADRPTIFTPFGLGVLDMALAQYVYELAAASNSGSHLANFLPRPWNQVG